MNIVVKRNSEFLATSIAGKFYDARMKLEIVGVIIGGDPGRVGEALVITPHGRRFTAAGNVVRALPNDVKVSRS